MDVNSVAARLFNGSPTIPADRAPSRGSRPIPRTVQRRTARTHAREKLVRVPVHRRRAGARKSLMSAACTMQARQARFLLSTLVRENTAQTTLFLIDEP